jgi:hypothetical protein
MREIPHTGVTDGANCWKIALFTQALPLQWQLPPARAPTCALTAALPRPG